MFKIAICDDDKIICSEIENIILNYDSNIDISIFYSAEALYAQMENNCKFDLVFLDIEMKKINGIEIGVKIREDLKDDYTQLLYISEKQNYAMDLFEARPLNFLVKPIKDLDIINSLEKAMELSGQYNEIFEFSKGKNYYKLALKDIMYFESQNKKIKVFTVTKIYDFYGKLSEVISKLHNNEFLHIHKSFLVNYLFISKINYDTLVLSDGTVLAISQTQQKTVREFLLNRKKENN